MNQVKEHGKQQRGYLTRPWVLLVFGVSGFSFVRFAILNAVGAAVRLGLRPCGL